MADSFQCMTKSTTIKKKESCEYHQSPSPSPSTELFTYYLCILGLMHLIPEVYECPYSLSVLRNKFCGQYLHSTFNSKIVW